MGQKMAEMQNAIFLECEFSTQEADAIFETDPEFQTAMEAFGELEQEMNDLIRDEGIVIRPDFNVAEDRVSPAEWEKMSPLALEFMEAGEAMVEALAEAFRAEGCDLY